jgi:hypothetical protein
MQAQYPPQRRRAVLTGLEDGLVGSVNEGTLRFLLTGAAPLGLIFNQGVPSTQPAPEWISIESTATLGTIVRLLRRGIYSVELLIESKGGEIAPAGMVAGICWNAPATILTGSVGPANQSDVSVLMGGQTLLPVDVRVPIHLSTTVQVSDQQIGTGTNVLTFNAINAAGGPITPEISGEDSTRAVISYVDDLGGA